MTRTLWLQLALTLLLGASLLVLAAGIRRRRHREWLSRLSSKYALGVVEGSSSREAATLAAMYEDRPGKLRLDDILVGSDEYGRYFAGERCRGRGREYILVFEPEEGTHIRDFSFHPGSTSSSLMSRVRGRIRRSARQGGGDPGFDLHWSAPRPQWSDERGLALAARVLFHAAEVIEESPLGYLHLRIDQRRVLIRCDRRLSGRELDHFLADATSLRRRILKSLRRVQGNSAVQTPPRSSRPVSVASEHRVEVLR